MCVSCRQDSLANSTQGNLHPQASPLPAIYSSSEVFEAGNQYGGVMITLLKPVSVTRNTCIHIDMRPTTFLCHVPGWRTAARTFREGMISPLFRIKLLACSGAQHTVSPTQTSHAVSGVCVHTSSSSSSCPVLLVYACVMPILSTIIAKKTPNTA